VNLRERLSGLEERERRLLGLLLLVAVIGVVLAPPVALYAVLHSRRSDVEAVRSAIGSIEEQAEAIARARADKDALAQRYQRPAPQLQAFLAKLASEAGVEIPESQDRQVVPRGKRFDERSTKITLRKVGMLKLVRFLEKIERSGHPVKVSQIDIRKRPDPDSWDVDMIVSAFDRKAPEVKPGAKVERDGGAPAASGAPAGDGKAAADSTPGDKKGESEP
jgi:type II secretory pathway component PulM